MTTLFQDLRYAFRMLRRSPGFTAIAVLSLALGIGANTAIFSLLNAVMLRELPVKNPGQLVLFGPGDGSGNSGGFPDGDLNLFSYPFYREIRGKNQVFTGVIAVNSFENLVHGTVEKGSSLEPMTLQLVSGDFFNVLGVNPILGRTLTEADDQTLGGHPLAVASYTWWTRRFARDPSIVGKTVNIGSTLYTIIGVAPPEFFGTIVGRSPDLWVPLTMEEQVERGPHKLNDKFYQSLDIFGRLKSGVSLPQASANVSLLLKQILHEYAGPQPTQAHLQNILSAHIELNSAVTGMSFLRLEFSQPLLMLMAIVGLVLLIACANIANLLLARATTRHREIAVRMAIGAGRARLMRQLLTESLLLALIGGALGILFAVWASHFLLLMVASGPQPDSLNVALDARVLAFTLLLSLATAVIFGIAPALRATRLELTSSLKEGRSAGRARSRLARTLIVSQVAISLVLLVCAGLFLRSLINLVNVNTGFNKQNVLLLKVDPTATDITDDARLAGIYRQVEERVSALPGVRAASFSIFTFHQGGWNDSVSAHGFSAASRQDSSSSFNAVGPGYFATMGLPIISGRAISSRDTANSPKIAVINETMARRIFPGGSPIGKRFGMDSDGPEYNNDIEVIGVVRDAKYYELKETPKLAAYFPYTQYVPSCGIGLYLHDFEVRFSGDPAVVATEVRRAIGEVNANLPIMYVTTLAEQVDHSVSDERLVAQLSTFFGLLAVFLACIGIYGLMSHVVARRINEIGIRMALGAGRLNVLWLVMRESLALVVIGLAIGVPAALASDRLIASLLFGLKAADPTTILAAMFILAAVATVASYLPARRASLVEPMEALRYE